MPIMLFTLLIVVDSGLMAGAECDAEALKRLLNETAAACQKCLVAVDSVATNQQKASISTAHSTNVSFCRVFVIIFI